MLAGDLGDRGELVQRRLDRLADSGAAGRLRQLGGARSPLARGWWSATAAGSASARTRAGRPGPWSARPPESAWPPVARRAAAKERRRWPASSYVTSSASMIAPVGDRLGDAALRSRGGHDQDRHRDQQDEHRQVSAPARVKRRDRLGQRRRGELRCRQLAAPLLAGVPPDQQRDREQPEQDERVGEAHGWPAGWVPSVTSAAFMNAPRWNWICTASPG